MERKRLWAVFVSLAAMMLLVAGCGSGNGNGGDSNGEGETAAERFPDGKIPIGLNVELSGPGAFFGTSRKFAVEAAVKQVNGEGGVEVEGDTYELEVLECDNRTDPTKGIQCAQEAVDSGVAWTTAPDLGFEAAYEIYRENGVLSMANGGTAGLLLTENPEEHPTLFFEFLTYQQTVDSHYNILTQTYPDVKRVAALLPDDENGRAFGEAFERYAPDYGIEYTGTQYHPPEAEGDFTAYLTSMKAQNPDAVFLSYLPQVSVPAAEQAADLDVADIFMTDLLLPSDFEGVDFTGYPMLAFQPAWPFGPGIMPQQDPGATGAPEIAKLIEKEAEGEAFLSAIATQAYISDVRLVVDAIEKADSLDSEAIAKEMLNAEWDGGFGPAAVNENHAVDLAQPLIIIDEKGKTRVEVFNSGFDKEPAYSFDVEAGKG